MSEKELLIFKFYTRKEKQTERKNIVRGRILNTVLKTQILQIIFIFILNISPLRNVCILEMGVTYRDGMNIQVSAKIISFIGLS